jgi:steroid delta-isomerase-like uncharacterized protein
MTALGSQDATQLVREMIDAFGTGDWERLRAALTPDATCDEVPTQRRAVGPDAIVELNREWKQAFPDACGAVTNAIGVGDTAVLEVTYEGTQDGTLETPQGPIPPSGKRATVRVVLVARVTDGRIAEVHEYFDLLTIIRQISAAPKV